MPGPEANFRHNQVVPFLKELKKCYFMSVQQVALIGDPDIVVCVNGKFIALEIKAENGTLSKIQSFKLEQIKKAGGLAFEVRPQNWNEIKEILVKLSRSLI